MLVSYKWLQEYFIEELPAPADLVDKLTKTSFEVEGMKEIDGDTVMDIDILPNRAHDCLSHDGIANEISLVFNLEMKDNSKFDIDIINFLSPSKKIILETKECPRYMACEISDIDLKESTKEIKNRLESLGQRSINNIVDITNIVLNETGQPLHAFDLDKVDGDIVIRQAEKGEKMTTLDDKEINLDESMTVIADDNSVLAIAGVKGGKKAEVDNDTRSIILESANFLPGSNRKTAQKVNIRTDASKRYENEIHPNKTEVGIKRAIELIFQYATKDSTTFHEILDEYPRPRNVYSLGVSKKEINNLTGLNLENKDIENIFDKMGIIWKVVNPVQAALKIVNEAIGKPYKYGASVSYDSPNAFDCSSLTAYAYSQGGVSIPRMTVDQFVYGDEINKEDLMPGDLIFSNVSSTIKNNRKIDFESIEYLKGTKVETGVDHLGIYVDDGKVLHATEYKDMGVVVENMLESDRFSDLIVGYKRIINHDEERYVLEIPDDRLDLRIKEDIIEEIGRLYGYDNIEEKSLDEISFESVVNNQHAIGQVIRKTLVNEGFSEVITYTFVEKGDIEMMKPFAEDKAFLRTGLGKGMEKAIEFNEKNMDLIGIDDLLMFEIGKTFILDNNNFVEKEYLCIGVRKGKGRKKPTSSVLITEMLSKISEELKIDIKEKISDGQEIIEISLEEIYENSDMNQYCELPKMDDIKYKTISSYPVMLRDISVWVPGGYENQKIVINLIKENGGELLVNNKLFDIWTKEEDDGEKRTSYAFRLVFQSQERTLSDDEINIVMDNITKVLNDKDGWEVR